jgi:putative Mg2+ transporter-C (MgtC) family protein
MTLSTAELLLRLTLATILGGLIGLERERVESTVGLRTHAIVALGAAIFMFVSMFGFANAGAPPAVVLDPSRVAAQIVTGIGFIGAGVIILRKEVVRGLTTAASIWLVAGIGMATAGGLYAPALGSTTLALAILAAMKPLERRLGAARRPLLLAVVYDRRRTSSSAVKARLSEFGVVVERADIRVNDDASKARIEFAIKRVANDRLFAIIDELPNEPGIREVRSFVTYPASATHTYLRGSSQRAGDTPAEHSRTP